PAGAGTAASFTFAAGGAGDVATYLYGLDTNPPISSVNPASLGGSATVTITPPTDGPHTVYVRSQDRAGNQSPVKAYAIKVGFGGLVTPQSGDQSSGAVLLSIEASPATTGVEYQWRRSDADPWATIPAGDVTAA